MPPVDAEALVRSVAEVVLFEHPEWDGFSLYDVGRDVHIVHINAALAVDGRLRFTWAHELGHIVLGHLRDYDCSRLPEEYLRVLDREADVFASELLMPREWVQKYVPTPCDRRSIAKLKEFFGVSWGAFVTRLDELRIQSAAESRTMLEEQAKARERPKSQDLWLRSRAR